ncbi:arsenic transporter [Gracilibacillus marinus]|uniref:Arsenic transporter n=1 Tax=Gracilibacillus marinus TaxID=630535 RepID=A0ABV8VZB2_9BACI
MFDYTFILTITIFVVTIYLMLSKPKGLNETIPTTIGAIILIVLGIVSYQNIFHIMDMVSGATFTILSTIVMTIILESVGFFKWVAINLIQRTNGSGKKLFFYIIGLCFFTTIFFNNDGSILITTPIIIRIVFMLKLKPHQQFPYLISGALIATAASAPIAISNIANLIALEMVRLDLNQYVTLMFVPSMIGIMTMTLLLYLYFKKDLPKTIQTHHHTIQFNSHPLTTVEEKIDWNMFILAIVFIVCIRSSYFILAPFGIPMEIISIIGATSLVMLRYLHYKKGIKDILVKTPWHILLFAFSMYVLVYALQNVGVTQYLYDLLYPFVQANHFQAILSMGIAITLLSNIVNNLPAVMIGSLTITEMGLDIHTLQLAYLANIMGSDIGALLTPVGTLATLIWMFILRKHGIHLTWRKYFQVTIVIIPLTLLISLISLYAWSYIITP